MRKLRDRLHDLWWDHLHPLMITVGGLVLIGSYLLITYRGGW